MQTTIFDFLYEPYKIKKPIRTLEFFAGYGSTNLAWKYLNVNVESWKICEWAVKSIQAYKDIHFENDKNDYSKDLLKEDIIKFLHNKGISSNYNEPMSLEQIKRLPENKLRTIYNNIIATHNLVNIQQVKGEDLEIVDTDKYEYVLSYSFPCQDLSCAGLKKGFNDTSTRSGMLWEVERILEECKELENLPQILIMENVIQIHSEDENSQNFLKWQNKLEQLGYKNYWEDLIATDYGIPQTRNRTFMISILGEYSYSFPHKQKLNIKLKDLLENNVDEKYFLSNKMIKYIESRMPSGNNKITTGISVGNRKSLNKAATITTSAGNRATDNYIIENVEYDYSKEQGKIIKLKENHLRKQLVNKLIEDNLVEQNDVIRINYTSLVLKGEKNYLLNKNISPTLTTSCGEEMAITTKQDNIEYNDLRIRKLTPKECFRLMGVKDEDYEKCAKNQSDASLFHLAGDSIVVDVLKAIFKQLI